MARAVSDDVHDDALYNKPYPAMAETPEANGSVPLEAAVEDAASLEARRLHLTTARPATSYPRKGGHVTPALSCRPVPVSGGGRVPPVRSGRVGVGPEVAGREGG